jgi:hypothetical protein
MERHFGFAFRAFVAFLLLAVARPSFAQSNQVLAATPTQFVELSAASRICPETNGDQDMRKASTELLEQGIHAHPLLQASSL